MMANVADGDDKQALLGARAHAGSVSTPVKSNNWLASANIVKSFIGVGILALPFAFSHGGIWFSTLALLVIAVVSNYTIDVLIYSKNKILAEGGKCTTFAEIGDHAFPSWGGWAVKSCLVFSQLGACVAYIIFISTNLVKIHHMPIRLYMLMLGPLCWLLAQLRNMKYLAPFSAMGIFAVVAAVIVVLYYGFDHFTPDQSFPFIKIGTAASFFGVAVFAMEGNLLAISLEESMASKRHFTWLLDCCMMFVSCMYLGFGFLGYLCFGSSVSGVITDNLPSTWIVYMVQGCLIMELMASYPVQLYPITEMSESWLAPKHCSWRELRRTGIRTLLVALTVLMAMFIPDFSEVIGLIGSFSNSIAGFILPNIFYLKICGRGLSRTELIYNLGIIFIMGFGAGGIATIMSVKNLVDVLKSQYG